MVSPFSFFFFLFPSYISRVHHSSSSSSAFPAISLGFAILVLLLLLLHSPAMSLGFTILLLLLYYPAISLGFTILLLLLLLPSQLYLWVSPFFFFCVPQLDLWASPFFFFFSVPQLYLWGSSFFFFCVPQPDLWGSPFLVRFLCMWPFFNPTIGVATFRLGGWCMLGVFLLRPFTFLGHECEELLSLCGGMHMRLD